jgi:hypothetical protein
VAARRKAWIWQFFCEFDDRAYGLDDFTVNLTTEQMNLMILRGV